MSALDRQTGGDHYKKRGMQPVELWAALNLNGFQASIVKYITRHKAKNGAEDIDKAEHVFALMDQLLPVRWYQKTEVYFWLVFWRTKKVARYAARYATENGLSEREAQALRCALLPGFNMSREIVLKMVRVCLQEIRRENGYPAPDRG